MAVIGNRLSSQVVNAPWIPPDDFDRDLDEDRERGPIALNDPSEGIRYQDWHLSYSLGSGEFTVTPQTVGSPSVVLTVPNVSQCSLAFDQNGHVNIAYTENGQAKLYWYDTMAGMHTTLVLPFGSVTPTICMDDKRERQSGSNDILLFYTREVAGIIKLFHRMQRERYISEHLYLNGAPPYIYKLGMHNALRVKIGLSQVIL